MLSARLNDETRSIENGLADASVATEVGRERHGMEDSEFCGVCMGVVSNGAMVSWICAGEQGFGT